MLVPCSKKKKLENVENSYIEEYAAKHANRQLKKRCNPAAKKAKERKKIVDKVAVHGELRKRIEEKLVIRDHVENSKFAENGSTPTLGTARGALKKMHC